MAENFSVTILTSSQVLTSNVCHVHISTKGLFNSVWLFLSFTSKFLSPPNSICFNFCIF